MLFINIIWYNMLENVKLINFERKTKPDGRGKIKMVAAVDDEKNMTSEYDGEKHSHC